MPFGSMRDTPFRPLVNLDPAPEYDPRRTTATQLPSWGFVPLRRSRQREATCAGFASPDCAAPAGFLSLLTLRSSRNRSGLVSCRWRPWGLPFRGLFLPCCRCILSEHLPLLTFIRRTFVHMTANDDCQPVARPILTDMPHDRDEFLTNPGPDSSGSPGATGSSSSATSQEGPRPGARVANSLTHASSWSPDVVFGPKSISRRPKSTFDGLLAVNLRHSGPRCSCPASAPRTLLREPAIPLPGGEHPNMDPRRPPRTAPGALRTAYGLDRRRASVGPWQP